MTEKQSQIACLVVGGLLVLESIATLILAVFTAIVGTLVGGLAIGVGAGSATDEQFAKGIAVIGLTLASPFVVAALLGVEGALLLARRHGKVVIAASLLALAAQTAFHPIFQQRFHAVDVLLCAVQLGAIALALPFARPRSASPSMV